MAFLQLRGITKRFPGTLAVDNLDLDVEKGDFLVLLGSSGCGKTTTLRIIAGLEVQTDGQVILDDVDISDALPERRDMAMVFQNLALYPHMTVFDNIAFYLRNIRTPKPEIERMVTETAARVEIEELLGRWPSQLSGGQRQRVALARALVRSPKVFLLDEPLASLDAKLRASMRSEFKLLHKSLVQETDGGGGTFIYVTHDQVEALTLGTRVAVMHDGKIVQIDSPADLYLKPKHLFTAAFVGSPEMNFIQGELWRTDGGAVFECRGSSINVGEQGLAALRGTGLEVVPATLGVRPEMMTPTSPGTPNTIPAEVLTVELLGHSKLVTLRSDASDDLTCMVNLAVPVTEGERIGVQLNTSTLHFFDRQTGLRL
jgi:multiple sugar transport system ATP-binding protein